MHRFYLNGKLFGSYCFIIHIFSVSIFPISGKSLKFKIDGHGYLALSRRRSFKSCLEEGKGEMTHVAYLKFVGFCPYKEIDLKNSNSPYKGLIEKVTKGCNGRPRCTFPHSRIELPEPMCRPARPYSYLHIDFVCKPKTIDNSTVLNMALDLDIQKYPSEKTYLVLELQEAGGRHRQCKVQGRGVSVKMLHLDFGPDLDSDQANGTRVVTLASSGRGHLNYTWLPSKTFRIVQTIGDTIDIDLHMSTGFVWLELAADIVYKVQCYGSIRTADTTSSTANTTLSTSTASTTTADPGPTTNKNAEKTESYTGQDSPTGGGTEDLLMKLLITLSVGLLAALVAILTIIVIAVFRRRKKRCIQDYDIPALTKQEDLSPYNKPITRFEDLHASKVNDYLDVLHCDYDNQETTGLFHQPDHAIIYEEIHG
ncbi:unnamed protein product [Lymnaea stagnalis]|uniref:SUEL-type lectin domain-containing protein n=1 Tax=Lymnaea stagnalis TaxID=6523 RepID=A0AAV2I7C7_LYMST